MACRFGACEINNNRPKAKKAQKNYCYAETSSEESESDDSCSSCSACGGSSSSCSCSDCNVESDSDDCCRGGACNARKQTKTKKKGKEKVFICKNGVCEWVPKKKLKNSTNTKKAAEKKSQKTKKVAEKKSTTKKSKNSRNC